MKPWVWDLETGFVDDSVGVDNQVEVEGSWPPPLFDGSVTPVVGFNGEQRVEQCARIERGLDVDHAVEVGVLIDVTDRIGFDDIGSADELDVIMLSDRADRTAEGGFSISEIGTDRDVGVITHGEV